MNDFLTQLPLALQFYLRALIYRNAAMTCLALAHLVQVAHDQLYRALYLAFPYSRRLWEGLAAHLVQSSGYLIIADTTWTRYGKKLAGTAYVWDSRPNKKSLGGRWYCCSGQMAGGACRWV